MEEALENMEENEKILEEMEKPFAEKLAEEKIKTEGSFSGGQRPTLDEPKS
jgi:hypothetical protein